MVDSILAGRKKNSRFFLLDACREVVSAMLVGRLNLPAINYGL
jgi:hypothetical protein